MSKVEYIPRKWESDSAERMGKMSTRLGKVSLETFKIPGHGGTLANYQGLKGI